MVNDIAAIRDDGNRVVYSSLGPMPGAPAGDIIAHSMGVRTDSGWRSEGIGGGYLIRRSSLFTLFGQRFIGMDSDFGSAALSFGAPLTAGGPTEPDAGVYQWFEGGGVSLRGEVPSIIAESFVRTSPDLSRIVFESAGHMLPSDAGRSEGQSIYELHGSTLRHVDIDTDGSLFSSCGSSTFSDGVSKSAERVYFINPEPNASCGTLTRIYLSAEGETSQVSVSQCTGDCGSQQPANFAAATPSGAVAFFTTTQRMTNADENTKRDLYRFNAETKEIELVSPGSAGMEGEVADSRAFTSTDGSVTYFYSSGRLLPDGGGVGGNLYVADEGEIRLVGPFDSSAPLRISSDGRFAMLSTPIALDGADTDSRNDIYLYDEQARRLTLVSRGSIGGNGDFDAKIDSGFEFLGDEPVRNEISEDGSRVFFGTAERLLPGDNDAGADIYEWHTGELSLLTAGSGSGDALFAGATPDGHTVVFRTAATLLPRDRDGGDLDLYAARLGGGFDESTPAEACSSCKPADQGGVVRPIPVSAATRPARRGSIRLGRIDRDACRSLRGKGVIEVVMSVPAPGRVSALGTGRLDRKQKALMWGEAGAVAPGRLSLSLRPTRRARRELFAHGRLHVRLALKQGSRELIRRVTLRCGVGG